jgi:hypothetical protein
MAGVSALVHEFQSDTIHAIAQACGLGTVIAHMAQMSGALCAGNFSAQDAHAGFVAPRSPEGKRKGLHTGIQEFDLESTIFDGALLANQLIQAMILDGA